MPLPFIAAALARIAPALLGRVMSSTAARGAGGAATRSSALTKLPKPQYIPAGRGSSSPQEIAPPPATRDHSTLEKLWTLSAISPITAAFDSAFPTAVHEITVIVSGGPYARIERLWQLCIATAFGKYREGPNFNFATSTGQYQAIWDLTGKKVAFKIISTQGGFASAIERSVRASAPTVATLTAATPSDDILAVGREVGDITGDQTVQNTVAAVAAIKAALARNMRQRSASPLGYLLLGPQQETAGGRWPAMMDSAAGAGKRTVLGGMLVDAAFQSPLPRDLTTTEEPINVLPDDGRMILSSYKFDPMFQNPGPPLDGQTRTAMVSLVAAALTQPGYFPAQPPPHNLAGFSVQPNILYQPGQSEPTNIKQKIVQFARYVTFGLFKASWDGYKPAPLPGNQTVLATVSNNVAKFERPDQSR